MASRKGLLQPESGEQEIKLDKRWKKRRNFFYNKKIVLCLEFLKFGKR